MTLKNIVPRHCGKTKLWPVVVVTNDGREY